MGKKLRGVVFNYGGVLARSPEMNKKYLGIELGSTRSIHGVVPPMVTPLKPDGSLDAEGTGRLVELGAI